MGHLDSMGEEEGEDEVADRKAGRSCFTDSVAEATKGASNDGTD